MEPFHQKNLPTFWANRSISKSLWRQQTNALENHRGFCRLKKGTNLCISHRILLGLVYLPTFVGSIFMVNLVGKYIPVPWILWVLDSSKLKTTGDIGMPLRGTGEDGEVSATMRY